jgi:hypothetical protein
MAQKPNRFFFLVVAVLLLAGALGGIVGAWNIARGPVVETLRAARLAPLPASAVDVTSNSRTQGTDFSVHVQFEAPLPEIDAWILHSPSANTLTPARPQPKTRVYTLPPANGAKVATVTVDEVHATVEIELDRGT